MITLLKAQSSDNAYGQFSKDSVYYILGDVVNVRLNPDSNAKVINKITFGERIRILEKTEFDYTLNGYTENWYKILFNQNGNKAEGYVWGGLIAAKTIKSTIDPEVMLMYGVTKVVPTEYYNEVYITIRACKNKKLVTKFDLRSIGQLDTYNSVESMGNKGVKGVKDIFRINFSDGRCAGAFGDMFFFWDGSMLYHAGTLEEGFDAPVYGTSVFIFPNDKKGSKKGYIINYQETGESRDNGNHIDSWGRITYKWDGSKLVVIKKEGKPY